MNTSTSASANTSTNARIRTIMSDFHNIIKEDNCQFDAERQLFLVRPETIEFIKENFDIRVKEEIERHNKEMINGDFLWFNRFIIDEVKTHYSLLYIYYQ